MRLPATCRRPWALTIPLVEAEGGLAGGVYWAQPEMEAANARQRQEIRGRRIMGVES
jgi:hypothetical protein